MQINQLQSNNNIKFPSSKLPEKSNIDPKDVFEFSSLNDTNKIGYDHNICQLKDKPSFLMEQYISNPMSISGHVMGGTAGTLSGLELTPKEEFKKFLEIAKGDPEKYVAGDLKLIDREGDAYLIRKLDEVPRKLLRSLVKSDYRKKDIEKEEEVRKEFEIGNKKPIKTEALLNKFIEIIQENPHIKPHMGEIHSWSKEAKRYNIYGFFDRLKDFILGKQKEFPAPVMGSKIFLLLACGWTSRFTPTGKEKELERKLMSYPDNSIKLDDVLRESYVMNKGDLYLTLLTIENVLAKNPYRENRSDDPVQKKLSYIRNDSKPLGDKYGSWYHFFGAALYGLISPEILSKSVVLTEAFGSYFLEGPDKQETFINTAGADFGGKLRNMMKNNIWERPAGKDMDKNYMDLTEFPDSI